jgi:transketolase
LNTTFLKKQADTIRFLATDMVQAANSGHPGAPMGLADVSTVLSSHINLNPKNESWLNRDRIVFSGGHASSLVYSLLHLWGFDVTLDDLKSFRQTNSKCAGHPEFGHTPGVEITTGPLGQGVANAVGFAASSKYAKNLLGSAIDHQVYCLCGDGDLQEGISYEALSTAGHMNLDNFVLIYDSNNITIEGEATIAWNEDVAKRFEAVNFDVFEIDGHDYEEINTALTKAKASSKPVLIIAKTAIAKGSANLEGSHHTHGAPLGDDEILASKKLAGFGEEKFSISDDVKKAFDKTEIGAKLEEEWESALTDEQKSLINELQNPNWDTIEYPDFSDKEKVATRGSNGQILNAIASQVKGFLGGSADLAPSNKSELKGMGDFPNGKNIHFGIKEHAMAAITNAMNLYGLFRVYSATFFVFSDYLKPSARVAALSNIPQHFIWTHDSIGVGEDGPTHQPIEHLSQFRAMPNFYTFRPADANENIACWKEALNLQAPSGFVLSRQDLPIFSKDIPDVSKGAYVVRDVQNPKTTLLASGSEVSLALEVANEIDAKVVSVPCFDLLVEQDQKFIDSLIDKDSNVVAIEASRSLEWYKFANKVIGMDSFGASGKASDLFEKFGFSKSSILKFIA